MKKYIFGFVLLLLIFYPRATVVSQIYGKEFGAVSKGDLLMTNYPKVPEADAVILNNYTYRTIEKGEYLPWNQLKLPDTRKAGDYYARLSLRYFLLDTETSKRIKILTPNGLKYTHVQIPFYTRTRYGEEQVKEVEATVYTLKNEKIVSAPLTKENIQKIRLNDTTDVYQLTFPNVKPGDIIEFKYKHFTPYYLGTPDLNFQDDELPVIKTAYEFMAPEAFVYNISIKGIDHINVRDTTYKMSLTKWGQLDFSDRPTRTAFFTADSLLPFKTEKHIRCPEEMKTGVQHELAATRFSDRVSYAEKWKNIENRLEYETFMFDNITKSNYFKKEIKELIKPLKDKNSKIEAILQFIKEKIRWNGVYDMLANPSGALKHGEGSSSQLNAMIISALRDNKIEAFPVLLSPRSNGRLPVVHPSFDKLKTFIVGARGNDNEMIYVDGATKYGGLNTFSTDLQVERARVFEIYDIGDVVDISNLTKNIIYSNITAEITPTGDLKGKIENYYKNSTALAFKNEYHRIDSSEYIKQIEQKNKISIENYRVEGQNSLVSNKITETMNFQKKTQQNGNAIELNPLVLIPQLPYELNDSARLFPLELNYPYTQKITVSIILPENCKTGTLPEPVKNIMEDGGADFLYKVENDNGIIRLFYEFNLKQIVFPANYYASVKYFFDTINKQNNTNININLRRD